MELEYERSLASCLNASPQRVAALDKAAEQEIWVGCQQGVTREGLLTALTKCPALVALWFLSCLNGNGFCYTGEVDPMPHPMVMG